MIKQRFGNSFLLFQIIVICSISLIMGIIVLKLSPLTALGIFGGLVLLIVTIKRPEIGLLGYLIITSTIINVDSLPRLSIGFGKLLITDIILLGLLSYILIFKLTNPSFKIVHTPLDLPLIAFVGIILFSTFIAIYQSRITFNESLGGIRIIISYLTFFIVTNLVRREAQISLLINGLVILATIVAGIMVGQQMVGNSIVLTYGRVETLATQGAMFYNVTRILPPGQSLVIFDFIFLAVYLIINRTQLISSISAFLQAGLLGLSVIMTFNRSFYVMLVIAAAILVFLLRGQDQQRLLRWGLLTAILGIVSLGFLMGLSNPRIERLIEGAMGRFSTLLNKDTIQEESLTQRYIENEYAFQQIAAHPIIGLGLRAQYRPWDLRLDFRKTDPVGGIKFDARTYIHNAHLGILLTSGWLGYIAYIWLSITFLLRGFWNWRRIPNVKMQAFLLACMLTYVGTIFATIVDPIYFQQFWTPILGVMMGMNEIILKTCLTNSSS